MKPSLSYVKAIVAAKKTMINTESGSKQQLPRKCTLLLALVVFTAALGDCFKAFEIVGVKDGLRELRSMSVIVLARLAKILEGVLCVT